MELLETRIPAPVVAALIALGMRLMPAAEPAAGVILQMQSIVNYTTAELSAVIAMAAFFAFWRVHTTINPLRPERASTLVTSGIYRYTRNPMYLSLLLLLLSYASHLWSWAALAGPLAFVLYVNRFQIVPEERVLKLKFGSEYAEYQRRVRRWL